MAHAIDRDPSAHLILWYLFLIMFYHNAKFNFPYHLVLVSYSMRS